MTRLEKIIALAVAGLTATCVGLVSQHATAALFAGGIAWVLLAIGMETKLVAGQVVPRRQDQPTRPIVRSVTSIVQLVLVFSAPATLVGLLGELLPEAWRGLAKLAVVVAVFALPIELFLGRFVDRITRASAPRRES